MYEHVYVVGHATSEPQDPNFQLDFIDGFKLPEGYLEYFQELGRGQFCGYITVFPQDEFAKQYEHWIGVLESIDYEIWWDEDLFSIEATKNSILLAESGEGSMLLFHPLTDMFVFLDRGSDDVVTTKKGLLDALRLYMLSVSYDPRKFPYFVAEDASHSIFYFYIEKKEKSFKEVNQVILDWQLHSEVSIQRSSSVFVVPELSGIIHVNDAGGHELLATLYGDEEVNPVFIDHLADRFKSVGFYDNFITYIYSTDR